MFQKLKQFFSKNNTDQLFSKMNKEEIEHVFEFFKQADSTIFNKNWYITNKNFLLSLFPEQFTNQQNLDCDLLVEKLKEINYEIKDFRDFAFTINSFDANLVFVRDKENKYLVKRNLASNLRWE